MWFLIGSIGILVLIVEAAARSVRAGMDVKGGGRTTGAMNYGQHDIRT